jgi:2-iminobutanoate/2-iminopropanoate deaminase
MTGERLERVVVEPETPYRRWMEEHYGVRRAVRVGNHLYVAGTGSVDGEGNVVAPDDLQGQFRQIYSQIGSVLKQFGASPHDVVEEMTYVAASCIGKGGAAALPERRRFYGDFRDFTATIIYMAGMSKPELLAEVKVVAILPDGH